MQGHNQSDWIRDCSFPASSSSLQRNRLKKAILNRKKGACSTPHPMWRMNARSPSSSGRVSNYSCNRNQAPVSARKLANALWEISKNSEALKHEELKEKALKLERSGEYKYRKFIERSISKKSERCDLMEPEPHSQWIIPRKSLTLTKAHLKDLREALSASQVLVGFLRRFRQPAAGQHDLTSAVFSALCAELEHAILKGDRLLEEQRAIHSEMNRLEVQLSFEIQSLKIREQERLSSSLHSIMKELYSEKKMRRRAERLNEKLAAELVKSSNELSNERRSRGIGEEKAGMEELRRAFEDLEKERKMLRLADKWREERVQMKLSEAKLRFEEKNAAVDQLRSELEAYLTAGKAGGNGKGDPKAQEGQSNARRSKADDEKVVEEDEDGTDGLSDDCDLHSIELNMDAKNRTLNWSYAACSTDFDRNFEGKNVGTENSSKEEEERLKKELSSTFFS